MKPALVFQMVVVSVVCFLLISCSGENVIQPIENKPLVSEQKNNSGVVPVSPERGGNTLVPISQYPLPGESIDRKFILVFDRKILFPPDVSVDDYIRTQPPIIGVTECLDNRIVFNILQPLPRQIEEIEFCLHPQLRSEDGKIIDTQNLCYRIPVNGMKVLSGSFEDVNENSILFSIKFNQTVFANDLKPFIFLTDRNDSKLEFEIKETENPEEVVNLQIARTGNEPYKLLIRPGYMDSKKKYRGQGAYFEFPLSEPLEVVECEGKNNTELQIAFSRPISISAIYKCISISSSNQNEIKYFAIPADWGKVQESAVYIPEGQRNLVEEKVSKSWLLQFKETVFPEVHTINLRVRRYAWSSDYALLPEEYIWKSEGKEYGFKVNYAYWKNNGLDGVSCIVNLPTLNEENAIDFLEIVPSVSNLSICKGSWGETEIKGDWKSGIKYIMKWKAGLKWGYTYRSDNKPIYEILEKDYVYTLTSVPEFKTLGFDNKDKFYIIPFQEKNFIRIGARNVSRGYIHVYRVLTENLSMWLGNVSTNTVPFEINERTTQYLTSIPVDFPDSVDKANYVDIDLTNYLSNVPKGIFTLCLSDRSEPGRLRASWEPERKEESFNDKSGEYGWEDEYEYYDDYANWDYRNENRFYQEVKGVRSDIRYILWTKIGVVSHWDDTSLVAFVHDLVDLSPQVGAQVTAYSIKNYKVAEGTTDNNGIVKIMLEQQDLGSPRLLTVKTEKDFSFVFLTPKPLPTLKDLEKYDSYNKNKYEAFIYTDRNLYRPGESIHSRWIVRTNYGSEVINAPLELRFVNPQNKIVLRKIVNLSEWGTGGEDILTEPTYLTGAYTLGLYVPGGERLCGSIPVYIEDFVPDRIKTEIAVANDFWIVGEEQSFMISSQYYVGPPAGGLPCKGKLIITPVELENETWKGYRFGNDELLKTVVMDLGLNNTNSEGKSIFTFEFDPPESINKPVEIAIVGEVSEAGGRAVSSVKKVKGCPEEILCGVGVEKIEDKLQVAVATVDKNFAPVSDEEVDVYLEKVEWNYVNRVYAGGDRTFPQWDRFFTLIEKKKVITSGGKSTVLLDLPPYYFTYRVRAQRSNGKIFSEVVFYCVPGKMIDLKGGPPELVKIHLENKKWLLGETVPVNIEVPFDGKAVVVIQGDKVWDVQVVDVVSGKGRFAFNIKEEYFPNVWVGVSALHVPGKGETVSPYTTFSFTKVEIEKPNRRLNIAISNIPEEIKPQNIVEFGVQTTDHSGNSVPAELTVAVVDEGIHSILSYTLPNPYDWFGRPRYSPIRRVYYYNHVAYDYNPLSPPGDMIARQLSAGKTEIGESWIKPLALWSGVVKTNEQGYAKVSFNIPEFNGTVRIVAVGANKELVGSTENKMLVRRPCVIQTHIPRFLRPQDRAVIFGRGLNSKDNPLDVNLSLTYNDVVMIEPSQLHWETVPKSLSISPEMVVSCLNGVKNAELNWHYSIVDKSGNMVDEFSENMVIPVRLPSIYEQRVKSHVVPPGVIIQLDTSEFIDNSLLETEIKVGSSPFLQIEPALRWLWSYSYCCCEQKISRLYPLYIFRNFLKESMTDVISQESFDQLLLTMIDDIFSHQQVNGGFSLWPYGRSTDVKVSLHVAFLLTMINRDKSLPLPEKPYQRMIAFLRDLSSRGAEESPSDGQFRAYATLILALNGDPSACERVNNLLKVDFPRNLRVLLLLTADICGKPKEEIKKYVQLLEWETSAEKSTCFWEYGISSIRKSALELISKIIAGEPLDSIQELQKPLIEYVSNSTIYTTYDLSMVLMALDMSFRKMNIKPFECKAEVKIDGESQIVQGTKMLNRRKQGPTHIEILNQGQSPLFIVWTIRGISNNPPMDTRSRGIQLKRFLYNPKDKGKISGPCLQGNVYIIEYRIESERNIENLILNQLLPAGFEVENPRLKQEQGLDLLSSIFKGSVNIVNPEHVEIRDDKLIVAFPPLNRLTTYSYVCVVRAVTKGTFEFPGTYIEDMYQPEVFARLAPEKIEIK